MQDRFATLELVPRVREGFGDPASGGPYKTRRSFLDFVINGVSLYDTIGIRRDVISVLWSPPVVPDEADRAVRRLLLLETGDASNGRVSLLVCPECGDLGCGAMTARIEQDDRGIVWRDIGYENTYDPGVDLDSFATLGPFIFEPDAYRKKLRHLLSR